MNPGIRSALLLVLLTPVMGVAHEFFSIRVVDDQTGRGVPLVELKTVHGVRHYTDSAGCVAFHEPGLMDREVFFHIRSHGYEFPADGFGYRGRRLRVAAGDSVTLKIRRINIARRLYRVTGAGIYRDTLLTGGRPPIRQGVLNAQVLGSDSVVNAVFQGRIYWFWGDTNRPSYPLGNFHVPGAVSELPKSGGLDPDQGVDLEYFLDERGFAKETCRMPGEGPTWIDALTVLHDRSGRQRLFAKYVKIKPPLTVYQRGLVEFNDASKSFEKRLEFSDDAVLLPEGHPLMHIEQGEKYVYFGRQYPLGRVLATTEALLDPHQYEAYTFLKAGTDQEPPAVERDATGKLVMRWRRGVPLLTEKAEQQMIERGVIRPEEAWCRLRDVKTGRRVRVHGSSVAWNEYRGCWSMIALEAFGSSALGEVWYAEAPDPVGPWTTAVKIVTHEKYSFYNPRQHPMLAKQDGRIIYFEGTYTNTFSGNSDQTPRYNYNQIMYRLDLDDPRLMLPPR